VFNEKTGRWIKKNGTLAKKLGLSPKRVFSKKRKQLEGGTVLGTGTTGSVISPALPCTKIDEDTSNLSSKIIFFGDKKNETRQELLTILQTIDPRQTMFIYSLGDCQSFPFQLLNQENKIDIETLKKREVIKDGVTQTGELQFFNMNLASSIDWAAIFQNNGLAQIKQMMEVVLHYLHLLHTNGIVHNDIKEENIMFGIDQNIRIVDFGQSQILGIDLPLGEFEQQTRRELQRVEEIIQKYRTDPKAIRSRKRTNRPGEGGGGGGQEEEEGKEERYEMREGDGKKLF